MNKINKKIRLLVMQILFIALAIFVVGCTKPTVEPEPEKDVLTVTYDELLYYSQEGSIKVTSIYEDDELLVESLDEKIIQVTQIDNNNYKTKAVGLGTVNIAIYSSYLEEEKIIEIKVEAKEGFAPQIDNIDIKLVEEGPYYIGKTYHLDIKISPEIYNDTYRYLTSEDYDINTEDLTIVFKRTGKMSVGVFANGKSKRFSILVDVKADPESETYDILFIGNSLTYVHDIPSIIQNMITSDGGYMVYSQDTPGGSYLQDHEAMFNMYIGKYAFSHVILQGQSYEPIDKKEAFLETMEKFGKQAKAIGAQVIVYESWAYDRESYKGLTRYEMTEQLKLSYEEAANRIGAKITRSGEAFKLFEETYGRTPSLYQDMNHQSLYGAYLSACVHYSTITGKKASDNTYLIDGLDIEIVKNIQKIADQISFGE